MEYYIILFALILLSLIGKIDSFAPITTKFPTRSPSPLRQSKFDEIMSTMEADIPEPLSRSVVYLTTKASDNLELVKEPSNLPYFASDVASLLTFSVIGRVSHGEDISLFSVFLTSFPFLLSYLLLLSPSIYPTKDTSTTSESLNLLIPSVLLSVPAGCILRGVGKFTLPSIPFVVASVVFVGLLQGAGRLGVKKFALDIMEE